MATNAAVSALLKPTSQHGRNDFPLDNKHVYSIKAGQITPVKCLHYEPGSYFDIQASDFSLTFPMQTAPFLRGRKEFAFYSVYYNAVWSLFNQYQGTRSDPKTSAFGQSPKLVEPRMSLYGLFTALLSQFFFYTARTIIIPRLLELDGETIEDMDSEFDSSALESAFFVAVSYGADLTYQISVNGMGGNCNFYSVEKGANIFSTQDFISVADYCKDIVGHWRIYNWLRKLDMLGYGNYYPLFKEVEQYLITEVPQQATKAALLEFFDTIITSLGTRLTNICRSTVDGNTYDKKVNLYPILAYNSVFYHMFRNSYYDLNYYTHDYSLDFVSVTNDETNQDNQVWLSDFSLRFLDIEYHQWKKDIFTGVLPDTQFGAVASIDLSSTTGNDLGKWNLYDTEWASPIVSGSERNNLVNNSGGNLSHTHDISSSFDVIALKRAEMLQDYRQQLMRAGNKTSDVFRAIYGGSPSSEHEDDIIPRFLDTFGEDIFIDPVQSTANTGSENPNGQLGDIAARGKLNGQSGHIKFNAGSNFGCILCLTYMVPEAEYNSYMFDKHIFELTPEQHYIPQLENYGLDNILSDELNCLLPASSIQSLGYGPRYYHKKSEVDQVHGAFVSVAGSSALFPVDGSQSQFYGDFNNWVSPRSDMQNRQSTSLRDFYINPSVLDNVFVRAAGADIADDQFICNTYFNIKSTKMMSKIGLINFV